MVLQVPATSRVSMGVSSMVLHKGVELVGMCVLPATLPTPQDVVSESETGVLTAADCNLGVWDVPAPLRPCCSSTTCAQDEIDAPPQMMTWMSCCGARTPEKGGSFSSWHAFTDT